MTTPKATILIVEDDPAILKGLMDVFVFNGYAPTGIADGAQGLEAALAKGFDLLVLDVMLPSLDGFSICRKVRKIRPGQPVLMLTAKGAEDDVVSGFRAGADDYVSKPFSLRELMVRVEALLRRSGRCLGQERIDVGGVCFEAASLTASTPEKRLEITRREMDIMAYLFQNRERIVSKKELLAEVWGYGDADIETRTVDIHIMKLRKKIAALAGENPFILTVRGEGYRLEPSL